MLKIMGCSVKERDVRIIQKNSVVSNIKIRMHVAEGEKNYRCIDLFAH